MKIVVIGGSGLIGTKLVARLAERGHDAVGVSPRTGVNALTGQGLAEALAGAEVVVDVSNAPSFEEKAVLDFFERSGRNLMAAEAAAGVKHHVALSIVGTDRLPGIGYLHAKLAQERLIKEAPIPYSIVRATQFFEFITTIAEGSVVDGRIVVPAALLQPIAAADVADALADVAARPPLNGTVEIAGPDKASFKEFISRRLRAAGDSREVLDDPHACYFGAEIDDGSLTAGEAARLGPTRFEAWLAHA
ncbi:NmrA family transcriptional regulator [Agaricicola taiwanensis]|uniref:NmrA family transcriptional regulator n=1 Tax=Agaricicola taiwanensis TaxID=591372 RepID=A0A8J2YLF7_9RHOB|nr:SDR family oxidoreductase [Agaricicola taiwanensis]GGE50017.1 NmrA family transcriptional regulator [Agaricicola taiwanensis]